MSPFLCISIIIACVQLFGTEHVCKHFIRSICHVGIACILDLLNQKSIFTSCLSTAFLLFLIFSIFHSCLRRVLLCSQFPCWDSLFAYHFCLITSFILSFKAYSCFPILIHVLLFYLRFSNNFHIVLSNVISFFNHIHFGLYCCYYHSATFLYEILFLAVVRFCCFHQVASYLPIVIILRLNVLGCHLKSLFLIK